MVQYGNGYSLSPLRFRAPFLAMCITPVIVIVASSSLSVTTDPSWAATNTLQFSCGSFRCVVIWQKSITKYLTVRQVRKRHYDNNEAIPFHEITSIGIPRTVVCLKIAPQGRITARSLPGMVSLKINSRGTAFVERFTIPSGRAPRKERLSIFWYDRPVVPLRQKHAA